MTDQAAPDSFESSLKPLWLQAQSGDEAAYRAALAQIAVRVRSFLRRRLADFPGDVEDLLQEILLAIHLQRGTHDPALPISNWIVSISRYKLIDHWRRKGRHDALHEPFDELDQDQQATAIEETPARRDLNQLFAALPEAQRTAIELIKLEGLSVAEASQRTGTSESALKVQVHRGLKRLADLVRKHP